MSCGNDEVVKETNGSDISLALFVRDYSKKNDVRGKIVLPETTSSEV